MTILAALCLELSKRKKEVEKILLTYYLLTLSLLTYYYSCFAYLLISGLTLLERRKGNLNAFQAVY